MKIAFGINENYTDVYSVIKSLLEFKKMGAHTIQCVNSIEEMNEDRETFAVFEIDPIPAVLYIMIHHGKIVNFMKRND